MECGTTSIVLAGEVIAQITPTNNMSSTFKWKFKQKNGKQNVERFQGETSPALLEVSIEAGPYEPIGLTDRKVPLEIEEQVELNTLA